MRRFPIRTAAAATLALSGSLADAQTPLFRQSPVRVTGVRAGGNAYAQAPPAGSPTVPPLPVPVVPGGTPMPMGNPMPPMGNPMGNPMGSPMGNPMGRETAPPPGVTEQRGTPGMTNPGMAYPPGSQPMPMPHEMYPGSYPAPTPYGADACANGFTYLNDCPPGGYAVGGEYGPLMGRPVLGQFVRPGKWYSSAEYLYWWTKPQTVPTLLTTSNAADNGILGNPSTQSLFGGSLGDNGHSGGRFSLGYWFGCEQRWGIDSTVFFLGSNGTDFFATSPGSPVLARPFTNANTGGQFSQIIASPGQSAGTFNAQTETNLWGGDINLRRFLGGTACRRFDLLVGFKYMRLAEDLDITENVTRLNGGFPGIAPNAVGAIVSDSFSTTNEFYGGQVGLVGEFRRGRWYLDTSLKVALGQMNQSLRINGAQQVRLTNGFTQTVEGGLLALPGANIGSYSQNKFAVIPEATINIGYHVTPRLRLFVGYNLLYASSVLRPGDQIDTNLDVTRIPNFGVTANPLAQPMPTVPMKDSTFFAQGISFGLQFKW